jgi:hypothetical protein
MEMETRKLNKKKMNQWSPWCWRRPFASPFVRCENEKSPGKRKSEETEPQKRNLKN